MVHSLQNILVKCDWTSCFCIVQYVCECSLFLYFNDKQTKIILLRQAGKAILSHTGMLKDFSSLWWKVDTHRYIHCPWRRLDTFCEKNLCLDKFIVTSDTKLSQREPKSDGTREWSLLLLTMVFIVCLNRSKWNWTKTFHIFCKYFFHLLRFMGAKIATLNKEPVSMLLHYHFPFQL